MRRLVTAAGLALLIGCATSHPPSAHPLIGRWSTDEVMSQLGPSTTTYTFRSDGTFDLSFAAFVGLSTSGRYSTDGDTITFRTQQKTSKARFHFDGGVLVVEERTDVFRLHRMVAAP